MGRNRDFDDDLPDWLKDAAALPEGGADEAETPGWQDSSSPDSSSEVPAQLGVTGTLPWRQGVSDPAGSPAQTSGLSNIDWDALDSSSAAESEFSFDIDETPAGADQPQGLPDWLLGGAVEMDTEAESDTAAPPTARAAGVPDWLTGGSDFTNEAPSFDAATADMTLHEDQSADWLTGGVETPEPATPKFDTPQTTPQGEADSSSLPDWFDDAPTFDDEIMPPAQPTAVQPETEFGNMFFAEEPDAGADEFDFSSAFADNLAEDSTPPAETGSLGIRRITPKAPEPEAQPQAPAERPKIRRLGKTLPVEKSPDELTFDEWEQLQQQQQYETEHAEELALEAEVPDWFRDNVAIGDADSEIASILIPDLSEAEPEPEPSTTPGTGPLETNFTPDWFLGLEEHSLEDAPEWIKAATTGVSDTGALLDVSAFAPPEPVEKSLPEVPSATAETPDWFQGLGSDLGGEEANWMAAFDAAATEAPDLTFADLPDTGIETLPATMLDGMPQPSFDDLEKSALLDDEAPSWLQSYEASAEVAKPASQVLPATPSKQDAGLGWLDNIGGADFSGAFDLTSTESQVAPPDEVEEGLEPAPDLDDLLSLYESPARQRELVTTRQEDELLTTETAAGLEEISPALLDALDKAEAKRRTGAYPTEEPGSPEASEPLEEADTVRLSEAPRWVQELRPDEQVMLKTGGLEIEFEQQGLAYLPEDLRELHEQTQMFMRQRPKGAPMGAQTWPLEGISGLLEAMPTVVPSRVELHRTLDLSNQQAERIELLAGVLESVTEAPEEPGETEEPEPTARRRRRRVRRRWDRLIISLILLGALLGPFASDALHIAEEPDAQEFGAQQQSVTIAIAGLQPGARVLVAFEYGSTAAGELNSLTEAVLRDMLRRRAIPVILSTNPLGTLNARYVLDKLANDTALLNALERDSALEAGKDYFTLRYVAGGPVAIRALAQSEIFSDLIFSTDSTGEETGLEIGRPGADDFAMVIVAGENTEDVRNWAEQFNVPGLPKYALVTAAAEPLVNAYVDSSGDGLAFMGYLAGYRDTYRYDHLRNSGIREPPEVPADVNIPDPELSQWHSMALGALVAALLMLIGMVINTLRGLRRRDA